MNDFGRVLTIITRRMVYFYQIAVFLVILNCQINMKICM